MEVTVTKFERHLDMSKVSVTFSIKKIDTGFATTMAGLVDMQGTDDQMVSAAWELLQPDVKYWLTTEKKIVGSTFTVPVPEPETEVVTVPEIPLDSSDQTHTE